MIRVAQVVYEPAHSGQSVHVLALAEHLDRERFELHVCYPAGDAIMRRRLAELEVSGHPWSMQRWSNAGPAWALMRLIRQERVDIAHAHGQFAGLWARPAARCAGACLVYTPHTIRVRQERLRRLYQMAEGALGRLTDRIISVSDADRRQLIVAGWAKPEHIITIPNGVDLGFWHAHRQEQAAARQQLSWDLDAPAVLQIGRLDGQKAPEDLVKAAELVVREQPDVRFYLAGDGPMRPLVEAQVRALGLEESVTPSGPAGATCRPCSRRRISSRSARCGRACPIACSKPARRAGRRSARRSTVRRRSWWMGKPATSCRHRSRPPWRGRSCVCWLTQSRRAEMGAAGRSTDSRTLRRESDGGGKSGRCLHSS